MQRQRNETHFRNQLGAVANGGVISRMRRIPMSEEIPIRALCKVVEYLHHDELHHFIECRLNGSCAEEHIYGDILQLLYWLRQQRYAADFARTCLTEYKVQLQNLDDEQAA
jgi:hypothetical protein